ncbi:FAD-dependent oxidoreductase [Actinomadura madurae]|uniref:FAD-dependent oxidoreductase n=1 Tax=Actinomadura madurae TaxID=1993 RepID=UPI0020D237AC|nr:FAD-dependent oxidoreductase [Actinomadura madurae]MCP9971920.1 FAD-dependent oxidoreductase [Actinomadura madurae]
MLIAGAGAVGLELAGEIKEVWPGKQVTIIDPAGEVLPGFEDAMREDLHRQLGELGVRLRLGTALTAPPGGRERPGRDLHRDHRRRRGDHRRHLVPRPRRGHQQRLPRRRPAHGPDGAGPRPRHREPERQRARPRLRGRRHHRPGRDQAGRVRDEARRGRSGEHRRAAARRTAGGGLPGGGRPHDPAPARPARRRRPAAHARRPVRRPYRDGGRVQGRRPVHRPLRRAVRHGGSE